LAGLHLWIAQFFSVKLKLFVNGRKGVLKSLSEKLEISDKSIWFHCASLGEFEQGVPIMEAVKKLLPDYKIVVSFFSPSGYENKKNSSLADLIVYLPLDTAYNARKFVEIVHPSLAIFVKYEFWPNYLFELKKNKIPTLLISGLFRSDQLFFKLFGGFMRKALQAFDHLFVQDEDSKELLLKINIVNCTISGDTRFDRVSHQIEQDNSVEFVKVFKGESICIVCGSTWPEDELLLLDFINSAAEDVKFVLAPHKINASKIDAFRRKLQKKNVLFSEKDNKNIEDYTVLIIDTIGLLTKIYSYADIAYVGGAAGTTKLHNILEPATFGVPGVIGQNFKNFPEAIRLHQLAGLFPVRSSKECSQILKKLVTDTNFRIKTGMICRHFINNNTGATLKIMSYIRELDSDGLI
jgi:3-deoxy-D-manno-octulosonic-acid transferase